MFLIHLVDPDGKPLTRLQDTDIPHDVISQIHDLRYGDVRMSLEDAVTLYEASLSQLGTAHIHLGVTLKNLYWTNFVQLLPHSNLEQPLIIGKKEAWTFPLISIFQKLIL